MHCDHLCILKRASTRQQSNSTKRYEDPSFPGEIPDRYSRMNTVFEYLPAAVQGSVKDEDEAENEIQADLGSPASMASLSPPSQ